jgi:pyruvate, water dikinase
VQPRKNLDVLEAYVLSKRSKVLTSGRSVGAKIATGRVRVIKSAEFIGQFQEGEVLVTDRPMRLTAHAARIAMRQFLA